MLPRVLLPKCDRRVTKSQRSRFFSILLKKEPSRPVAFAMSSLVSPDLFSDNNLTIDIYVSALLNRALYSSSNSPLRWAPSAKRAGQCSVQDCQRYSGGSGKRECRRISYNIAESGICPICSCAASDILPSHAD